MPVKIIINLNMNIECILNPFNESLTLFLLARQKKYIDTSIAMKAIYFTLFLFCFESCIFGPNLNGFRNLRSATNNERVYYETKSGEFKTNPFFRGHIVKVGTVVTEQLNSIHPEQKKKRTCETTNSDLTKTFTLLEERVILAVYETSGFICIEYY